MTELRYARCGCRWWPVQVPGPIGSCGMCGEIPLVDPLMGQVEYENWHEDFTRKTL